MALNRKLTREEKAILEQQAELERKLEAVQAEARAKEAALLASAKVAGLSAYRVVDALYDLLEVERETPKTRAGKNGTVDMPVDKTEEVRAERLLTMLETIIDQADPALLTKLQNADRDGVEMRHLEREERREKRGRGRTTPTPIHSLQNPLVTSEDDDEDEGDGPTPVWGQAAS